MLDVLYNNMYLLFATELKNKSQKLCPLPQLCFTFTCFVDIFLHRAGRAAVLGTAESFWFKDGSGEFADTGFMVKFPTSTNRATLHICARHFTWKTWVLSSFTFDADELSIREWCQSQALQVEVFAALSLTGNQRVAGAFTDLTHSVLLTRSDASSWQTWIYGLHVRNVCICSGWRAIYLLPKAYLQVAQASGIGVRRVSVCWTSHFYISWGAAPFL